MAKIDLEFGSPLHGWLDVRLCVGEISQVLDVSDVSVDSLRMLIDALAGWYDGFPEGLVTWFLEPDSAEWIITHQGDLFQLDVSYIDFFGGQNRKQPVLSVQGTPTETCVPIWRALRRLEADPAWSSASPETIWGWPFPTSALAALTRRVEAHH